MRTSRKSWTAVAAGAASVAIVAAGCSSGDGNGGNGDGPITLTVATFNEWGYEALEAEYEELNPNVDVVLRKAATSGEARDKLVTGLGAGAGLSDIEGVEVDWLPELLEFSDRFNDLSDPEVEGRWLDWKVAQATTPDGKLIGYGTDIGPEAICYRADLIEAAGFPSDRESVAAWFGDTWDSYFAAGEQFKGASDVPWFDSAGALYVAAVNQVENMYEENDGTPIPLSENDTARELYDMVLQAGVDDGLSSQRAQWSEDWFNSFQASGADSFATMLCPGWMLGVIEGSAAGVEGWDIADTFPGGGGNWGGSFLTIPTQTANFEEARKLAAWLTAPEQQIKAFQAVGTFPSQVDALEDPVLLGTVNAFFNDAPTGEILANRAEAISVQPYKGPNYFKIQGCVTDAINRVEVDKTDDRESSWNKAITCYNDLGL